MDNYLFGLFPVVTLPAINSYQRSQTDRGPRSAPGGSTCKAGLGAGVPGMRRGAADERLPGVSYVDLTLLVIKLL